MDRSGFFYKRFRDHFPYGITSDQDRLFSDIADFITGDDHDILVVNGYAGTGKTTALAAVIEALDDLRPRRSETSDGAFVHAGCTYGKGCQSPVPICRETGQDCSQVHLPPEVSWSRWHGTVLPCTQQVLS